MKVKAKKLVHDDNKFTLSDAQGSKLTQNV